MNFIEIQSWPEVPQIGFFTSLFSSAFNLPDFDIEDLEEALLLDSSENNVISDSTIQEFTPRLVPDLIVALLKGCDLLSQSWPNITASNFQMFLRRIFRHKCEEYEIENPFNTDVDFHSLSLRTKVVILNYLCEFRLDSVDVDVITNNFEADSLRIQPLGFDSNDSVYWYFFGTRLYREDFKKTTGKQKGGGSERVWQVICFSEEDWHNLANKFKNSKSRKENSLYKCLTEDFLPNIPDIFKAKEAERRRRLFQRRTSTRVKSLLERQKLKKSLNNDEPYLGEESDEESQEKLSFNEKFLEEKKRDKEAKSKIRERIQHERALRAQRRSSSISSASSTHSSLHEESEDCDDAHALENISPISFNNNKENILIKKRSNVKLSTLKRSTLPLLSRIAERIERKNITRMPPVTTKLPGRQTNNSLSSVTGNIVIQTPSNAVATSTTTSSSTAAAVPPATNTSSSSTSTPSSSQPRKKNNAKSETKPKKQPPVSKFMETDEVLQIGMHKVLQQVKNHDDAWPFMDPVEEDIAPRYYSIIKRPMDLMKMEDKLDNGEYHTFAEFRTDFKLIVNNCRLYNGQNNEYTQMVNNLQIAFDRATKKYFDQSSSDEEQVLLEYPPIIEPVNKSKASSTATVASSKVQKSENEKKNKHNSSSNNNKKHVRSDVSSEEEEEDNEDEVVVEKSNKKIKKKEEKKNSAKVEKEKDKSAVRGKRKREKDDSENASKSKKVKKSADFEDNIKDSEIISVNNNNKVDSAKKSKKNKEKNVVLKELKSNKKSKNKKLVETTPSSKSSSKQKQLKQSKKSSPVKAGKSEKEKLKNNHNNKYLDSSDMSSDNESIRDLINEDEDDEKVEVFRSNNDKKHNNNTSISKGNSKKQKQIKETKNKSAKQTKKHKKSSKSEQHQHKSTKYSDDAFSMSESERSRSPVIPSITDDFDSSFERKEFAEIKDKFDLIKERRNKNAKTEKPAKIKESGGGGGGSNKKEKDKEKTSHKDKHVKEKRKEEKLSVFDELLAETKTEKQTHGSGNKSKAEIKEEKVSKKHSKKEQKPTTDIKQQPTVTEVKQKGSKKQNKASLDVLDMETEQTLKDINKWLEHTPRFEYSSASNSPSRYVIDDIDMHSKIDDSDFRKPIPLMPSSPSTSNKVFHSSLQKDDKILKDTNNKGSSGVNVQGSTSLNQATNANAAAAAALNKKALKEQKRKSLKDKLQPMPKKKEIQRTIDRLQPGKTKGNLLSNIQNINKPEELFPLGSREKVKEIKSSLTVEPDENGPQLNLGKVLDPSTFNMCDPKVEKECFSDNEPCERKSLSDSSVKGEDIFEKSEIVETDSPSEKEPLKINTDIKAVDINSASDSSCSAKPNLNAWFKAFGVPKKPKVEEPVKKYSSHESKIESTYTSSRQRKLSTGSSISERSSVEDSPQVGLDERGGAPAPFPSPIGASPMSMTASPKPEETIPSKSNYPINSSTRVGFYQDTTSTKSSPDKSCSPREMLSPYHGHYSQQSNSFSSTNANNSNAYSNFYNPEASGKQRQTSYSKPTNSPTPYYDQYKQPMSQESDFNNSMSPNTNPNSPYHSQQSSPYQQQPNSPYQQSSNSSGTNISNSANVINTTAPNSPYSQPNSPYQQNQAASPYNQQAVTPQQPQAPVVVAPQNNQQPPNFNNQHYNALYNQQTQPTPQQEMSQFSPTPHPPADSAKMPPNPNYNINIQAQKPTNPTAAYNNPLQQQQQQAPVSAVTKANSSAATMMGSMPPQPSSQQQQMMYPENLYVDQAKNRSYANKKAEPQTVPPLNEPRYPIETKSDDNPKYLDLSKQTNRQHPQYQQPPVATVAPNVYSKPEYDKNASYEMLARSMQKNASYGNPMESCAVASEISYDGAHKNVPTYGGVNQNDSIKDLTKSSAISNLMQNPSSAATNLMHQAHQSMRNTQPTAMDYKQSPLFNTPSASSMMELTAFMRDFRSEDRFTSFPNPTSGFYDKPMTPSHMFGKNISSSASTLQQMFSNPMTTMAYGREQQEYQNRLNAFQAAANTPSIPTPMAAESKAKKPKKSKKNPSPDVPTTPIASQHPAMAQHQMPPNQQQSHQQFAMHQQSFQSFAGLKIPSAGSTTSTDPMKAVVPGSAFNYGPSPLGLYGENSPYLDEFRGSQGSYYPPALRSSDGADKTTPNPPQAHPAAPSSPYHHLLPSHHPPRSYPFMNSIDPATLQQQYRMMFNQTYNAGYLGMQHQPPWHM